MRKKNCLRDALAQIVTGLVAVTTTLRQLSDAEEPW